MDFLHNNEFFVLAIIALSIGGGIIKRYMALLAQRMDQRITSQDQTTASEIAAMRQELAQLRDTSTQFDMSLQRSLEEMQHRLEQVENKRPMPTPAASAVDEPTQQSAGLGNT